LLRVPVLLPIPGPPRCPLEENCAAAAVTLDDETFDALDALRD